MSLALATALRSPSSAAAPGLIAAAQLLRRAAASAAPQLQQALQPDPGSATAVPAASASSSDSRRLPAGPAPEPAAAAAAAVTEEAVVRGALLGGQAANGGACACTGGVHNNSSSSNSRGGSSRGGSSHSRAGGGGRGGGGGWRWGGGRSWRDEPWVASAAAMAAGALACSALLPTAVALADAGDKPGQQSSSPLPTRHSVPTSNAMGCACLVPVRYEEQKRTIEDCLLLPLLRPDVYARLARATRKTFASNRPRAVLFEGPPGTGKTTSARVISSQAAVPLIYLPLEAVLSKWYGESEQQLSTVFKAAEALGGAIIFLDELDALGGNREGGNLHEASRRLLSVLLREMEGFDADKKTVVIGATNRKADLDTALLSRFDLAITFGLPDANCRWGLPAAGGEGGATNRKADLDTALLSR
ncbi:Cell division control protein 48 [Tetrabaena socialis]|uniref:Cell division control protein 48 n=1 Tax=Tetrabaena socialis TaxID=47790 RepID=A0A2J7ZIB7_9CHLO|nr:Cell division control protein 48 [Tetrabaena socialis]|eukprot:PNH00004.1 Cell division control protein 48 [Tetrabaena socialis]